MGSILLTGASGVVGAAVLRRLAGKDVVALTYRGEVAGRAVRGDITRPRLGLDRHGYAELARGVDAVVHCAGVTDFTADDAAIHAQNVRGTEQITRFAIDAGARLVLSSTAFVDRLDRAAPAHGGSVSAARYLESKLAAEDVVGRAGLPAAIARISIVIGDSVDGAMSRFQGIHNTSAAVLRNLLPVLPFAAQTTVDMLPRDLVADALVALAGPAAAGGVYWITSGLAAPEIQRMVELAVHRADQLGFAVWPPRFVPPAMVNRVIRPVFVDSLPPAQRRRFDNLMALVTLFDGAAPFPCSLGTVPGGPPAPDAAQIERAFLASIDHLARTLGLVPEVSLHD
ncbi:MAG TPA: SDR family oxidoreductase [Micromonosporaceae bacterium]|nr:SDR family oxidoreductase [Micromonosporaceae bacterium]